MYIHILHTRFISYNKIPRFRFACLWQFAIPVARYAKLCLQGFVLVSSANSRAKRAEFYHSHKFTPIACGSTSCCCCATGPNLSENRTNTELKGLQPIL